jgi:hypothetical protein
MIIAIENPVYLSEAGNLLENSYIKEMAVLRKSDSGLPANLFLDDTGSWTSSGHWKRIKFQPNTGDNPISRAMVPMSIGDNPQILVDDLRIITLNAKQIRQIKAFVRANKDLLLQLADKKIKFGDFIRMMVKV